MKTIYIFLFLFAAITTYAQSKVITQAIVSTVTNVIATESNDADIKTITTSDGQQFTFNQYSNGKSKTTTWLKNQMVKTYWQDEMSVITIYRDNEKKQTTTISERMGKKSGYYATDTEQVAFLKQLDSIMQSQGLKKSAAENSKNNKDFTITYLDESKIIIGYTCKKALIIEITANKSHDTTIVWYCPDFKLQNLPSTGGIVKVRFRPNGETVYNGMENLTGFPLQYEKNMSHGRKMTVEVTKLITDKEIADKEFEIPKNIEIKPMKDMQSGAGPGVQLRVVGGG